ncbi:hypothetical protein BH24BAC1_BH24BAC1_24470 [soil metagenome]
MKRLLSFNLLLLLFLLPAGPSLGWGFYAHQRINRLAVFALPPEMFGFYKRHIRFLTEHAVNPDRRRYAVKGEAPRHFIDIDRYGDSAIFKLPRFWREAVSQYSEDSLQAYGIVPWHINAMKHQLTEAFRSRNPERILRLSADLGHYVADACVPLHTTQNYNGQLTGQRGIHGLWESRLPELLAEQYDFFVGPARYLRQPQLTAWQAVTRAHLAVDSVLRFERELTARFPSDKKYTFEERGATTMRVYSQAFSREYHQLLGGQVERQMRLSILLTASYWYTCWVDAGQPDLEVMAGAISGGETEKQRMEQEEYQHGEHPDRSADPPDSAPREERQE